MLWNVSVPKHLHAQYIIVRQNVLLETHNYPQHDHHATFPSKLTFLFFKETDS